MLTEKSDPSDSPRHGAYDAIVVGSGPNGMAAAIRLSQKGASVLLVEAAPTPGGGMRSAELTLPGFIHDVCSAVHPMAQASPFFRTLGLEERGVEWVHGDFPVVHPLTEDRAVVQHVSVGETAKELGRDERAYRQIMEPLAEGAGRLYHDLLGPFKIPRYWKEALTFGRHALFPATHFARGKFRTAEARALFAGHAAHSVLPLDAPGTTAFGLMLGVSAHAAGWPVAKGGSQSIARALLSVFESLGGEVICNRQVNTVDELPKAKAYLFDVAPRALASIGQLRFPERYMKQLRAFRHGPAAFKVDYALSDPIPWMSEACRRTANLHVGGDFDEVAKSEKDSWQGRHGPRPFLILSQPTVVDPSRAPEGKHTAWVYAHVPHGSTMDVRDRIESQIERFAPGFRDTILESHVMTPGDFESYNPNYVGGDIVGGVQDLRQLYTRPVPRLNPYRTPERNLFICSASTPPGAGVHGMCGYHAAGAALDTVLR